ncbi:MAG TPA: YitT family protein [Ignavibacteriales bacterium]|nr:YitT family protein [Ignavibacteriales bacterium]
MQNIKSFLLINLGLALVAAGIHFFKIPNDFATGGVSGLAIIIQHFLPNITVGPWMLIINTALLIAGFVLIGRNFGSKTIYSSFALSGMVWVLQFIYPMHGPFTHDTMLELVMSILLPAVGSAIVFNQNASTGGTDIVAKVLSKLTSLDIGKSLLLSDFAITILAGVVFGIRVGMYSFLGLVMKGFIIDIVIEGLNARKQMIIISEKPEIIRDYIMNILHRGATIYTAYGAFTGKEEHVIITVLSRAQAVALRNFIRENDPKSFITITNTSEIIGKGFRSILN